jgi:signal transduction histidine kinase
MNTLAGKTLFMLDNILKWANLQRGFLKPNPERFLLDEVILFNIDLYSSIAKNRNIDISYSSNANIFVYADRNMVDATIRNLLNNAIKFTGQNGIISINHRIYDEFVEVQISDTGVGIDADKIKTLLSFESNSKKSSGSDKDGSGLGLVLAREFIEKNGGAMWVHSAGLGKGSTFYFTLKQHTP